MTRWVRVKRHVYLWVLSIEMVQHIVFPHNLRQRWGVQKIENRPKNRTLWHTMIWWFRAWKVEISPRTDTYWWRSLKLNWNHDKALPLIPKQHSRRCNKIPWSTRSKGAERSSSNKATDLLSIALKISSWTSVSVQWRLFLIISRLIGFTHVISFNIIHKLKADSFLNDFRNKRKIRP